MGSAFQGYSRSAKPFYRFQSNLKSACQALSKDTYRDLYMICTWRHGVFLMSTSTQGLSSAQLSAHKTKCLV